MQPATSKPLQTQLDPQRPWRNGGGWDLWLDCQPKNWWFVPSLLETNIALVNGWSEDKFPFGMASLQVRTVSFRECRCFVLSNLSKGLFLFEVGICLFICWLKAWPMPSVPRITHYIDYAAGGLVLINSFALMFLGTTKLLEVIWVKVCHVCPCDTDGLGYLGNLFRRLSQGRCKDKIGAEAEVTHMKVLNLKTFAYLTKNTHTHTFLTINNVFFFWGGEACSKIKPIHFWNICGSGGLWNVCVSCHPENKDHSLWVVWVVWRPLVNNYTRILCWRRRWRQKIDIAK